MSEGIPKKSENMAPVKHFLAGGVAGAISRTCVSPLERLKILYQVAQPAQSKYNTSILQALANMYKEDGLLGYFKGNGTNVIRIFPYSAVQFAAFEKFKILFIAPGESDLTPYTRLLAGALAGITSVFCTYPLDLIRTRLSVQSQTDKQRYNGIANAFVVIVKNEGPLALWKGIGPTTMGVAPYVGLNFMCYETLKSLVKVHLNPNPTTMQLLFCGGVAGTVAQTITYPLDVLRRKMQMQGFGEHPVYGTTWNCIKTVYRKEKIYGLYRGLIPNYLKVVPSISISFVVYERVKTFLGG